MGSGASKLSNEIITKNNNTLKSLKLNDDGLYCQINRLDYKLSKSVLHHFQIEDNFSKDVDHIVEKNDLDSIKHRNTKIK